MELRWAIYTAALTALIVSYTLTPLIRIIAIKTGIVVHPGGRRVHATVTPLLGGIAMFTGFMTAIFITTGISPILNFERTVLGIVICASIVAIMGVIDDKYELSGLKQALIIVIAAYILTRFGVEIKYVTIPIKGGTNFVLGLWSVPITIIWVLMVTKAVDCMDGLDGLAAGIAVITSATLMIMALVGGHAYRIPAFISAALMGSAIGFLRYNYPPAKIFMGTVGSQFLGFTLASISIVGAFKIPTLVAIAIPILVLGVPLIDTTFVVIRRAASGKKIHEADTTHLHHRLVEKGLSHRQVIWVIYAMTAAFCATALVLFIYAK